MKWISVKDELPQKIQLVLCASNVKHGVVYDIARYVNRFYSLTSEKILIPDYWAPIAPLPKDGE
jgi:hypothetical protein